MCVKGHSQFYFTYCGSVFKKDFFITTSKVIQWKNKIGCNCIACCCLHCQISGQELVAGHGYSPNCFVFHYKLSLFYSRYHVNLLGRLFFFFSSTLRDSGRACPLFLCYECTLPSICQCIARSITRDTSACSLQVHLTCVLCKGISFESHLGTAQQTSVEFFQFLFIQV